MADNYDDDGDDTHDRVCCFCGHSCMQRSSCASRYWLVFGSRVAGGRVIGPEEQCVGVCDVCERDHPLDGVGTMLRLADGIEFKVDSTIRANAD